MLQNLEEVASAPNDGWVAVFTPNIRPFQRFFGREKMYRSTKGASKARRDQINAEIRNLKDLLPISDADKARLSYLHIMSLACIYTRKSVFFSQGRVNLKLFFFNFTVKFQFYMLQF